MIICNIQGGLGNQMFQYAMGLSLALDANQEIKFSVDSLLHYGAHNGFELSRVFNLKIPTANKEDLENILGSLRSQVILRRILSLKFAHIFRGQKFFAENSKGNYSELLLRLDGDLYLQGYWQSEEYFSKNAEHIRKVFNFPGEMSGKNLELLHQFQECDAVSIHVRRGDYARNPKALKTHGLCSLEYYDSAIHSIQNRVKNPHYYVFTDDADWVAATLLGKYPNMSVINHNTALNSFYDMRLMSVCKHHIIANSSFSWWGAWLNSSNEKIVIAPRQWFVDKRRNAGYLLPSSWERM